MWWGGSIPGTLIDEWRRALVVGHFSARDSMKGTLSEDSFTGEPERWCFWEVCKMPCKRACLFIRALLGNLEGVLLQGLLREKESTSGFQKSEDLIYTLAAETLNRVYIGHWIGGYEVEQARPKPERTEQQDYIYSTSKVLRVLLKNRYFTYWKLYIFVTILIWNNCTRSTSLIDNL